MLCAPLKLNMDSRFESPVTRKTAYLTPLALMVVMRVTAEANLLDERNTRLAFTVLCSASISVSSAVPLEPEYPKA